MHSFYSFHVPFRSGVPRTALGGVWDCALDGRPFLFDRDSDGYRQGIQSLSILRDQSDTSDIPGEGSMNRQDSWRAGQSLWHKGAGQKYRDGEDADHARFYASQGIDVWEQGEISLLNGVENAFPTTESNVLAVVAGNDMFVSSGSAIKRFDGTTWHDGNLGAETGRPISFATNGDTVWAIFDGTTNYYTNAAERATTAEAWVPWNLTPDNTYDSVAYARGRLLVTEAQFLCEVRGDTVARLNPGEVNASQRWTAIAEGSNAIFAAATTGGRSQIHRVVPPTDDPSGFLGVPVPAAPALPTGEVVSALYGYVGQLIIGTNQGVRVAQEDGNGNLSIGPLIELPSAVDSLAGDGRFVWFSWSNFSDTHTGIGRFDLSQLVAEGTYAYASDLMAPTQGSVTAIASFQDKRYFAVQSHGLFSETDELVDEGWIDSGQIRYGVIDDKVARKVQLRHATLAGGSVAVLLSVNQESFVQLGVSDLEGTTAPVIGFDSYLKAGVSHEIRLVLRKGDKGSPVVENVQLRADLVPTRGMTIFTALLLSEHITTHESRHPLDDYNTLVALANYKRPVTYQYKSKRFSVTVQDFQFIPSHETKDKRFENGTMILKLKAAS